MTSVPIYLSRQGGGVCYRIDIKTGHCASLSRTPFSTIFCTKLYQTQRAQLLPFGSEATPLKQLNDKWWPGNRATAYIKSA